MEKRDDILGWHDTKKRIVDAGVALMRARGFNATSLDEVCEAAGVTKGGFFHYFKNKEDLAKAAIARFNAGQEKEYEEAAFRKLADPLERVFGRLEFVKESIGSGNRMTKGCLVGMLTQELAASNSQLREACLESFSKIRADFETDLSEAKAAYAPRAAFDPKTVANLYVTIVQGSLLLAKANASNGVLANNISEFGNYLQSLFGTGLRTEKKRTGKSAVTAMRG